MDLYSVLGVAAGATHDEIRAAYRKKAMLLHPDRGGTFEQMAELNTAYDVLGDPERRQQYDATGSTASATEKDAVARAHLLRAFSEALQSNAGDLVFAARGRLQNQISEAKNDMRRVDQLRITLRKRRAEVTRRTKGEMNLLHTIIDQELGNADQQYAQAEQHVEAIKAALKMLDDYESKPSPPDITSHFNGPFGYIVMTG